MIIQLDSISNAPNQFSALAKYDATHLVAGGLFVPPSSGDSSMHMLEWDGSNLNHLMAGGLAGGEVPTPDIKIRNGYIYRSGVGWTTASGAGVGQCEWDGVDFVNPAMLMYYTGMIGMDPNEYRGWVYGYDGAGAYMYVCGRTWTVVSFPPYVLKYVYSLDALQSTPGGSILKKSLAIATAAECGRVLCHGGYIYLIGSASIKQYTFNGTNFTLVATLGLVNIRVSDGTYIYGTNGQVITAYTSALGVVVAFDTGAAGITELWCSGGRLFVRRATGFKLYTFDGVTFTLEDESALVADMLVV